MKLVTQVRFVIILCGLSLVFNRISYAAPVDNFVYVQVRSSVIHASPSHFSTSKSKVSYGDELSALEESGSWVRVRNARNIEGYIHTSALTSRRLNVSATKGTASKNIEQSDIALAGKGFNSEVEKQLAQTDLTLNFAEVDRIEKLKVSDSEILSFVNSGKLNKEQR